MVKEVRYLSQSPEDTRAIAAQIAAEAESGWVIALEGDLGAGKTCFVQGFAQGLGIDAWVTSPTYSLIQEYDEGRLPLAHMDLYRLSSVEEAEDIGLLGYLEGDFVCLIEWSARARECLPATIRTVRLRHGGTENERTIVWEDPV